MLQAGVCYRNCNCFENLLLLFRQSACLFHLVVGNAQPTTGNRTEATRTGSQSCYIHVGNGGLSCCLGIASITQLLKKSAWLLYLIGYKASPTARDSSEVARA